MMALRKRGMLALVVVCGSAAASATAHGALIQAFNGPYNTSGGGTGTVVVDTASDAADWITQSGFNGAGTGTLYYGFDVLVTNNTGETGAGGLFSALQLFTGTTERLGVTNNFSSVNWSYFNGPGNADLNANPVVGGANPITPPESARIVVRVNYNSAAAGDETATIWFNPNPLLTEIGQDPGITTATGVFNGTFDTVRARSGNGTSAATYSNIKFANDFTTAVVPEPASIALLGLGAVSLLTRRRAARR